MSGELGTEVESEVDRTDRAHSLQPAASLLRTINTGPLKTQISFSHRSFLAGLAFKYIVSFCIAVFPTAA